ncbi:GNAT family N-acetyltransferase [Natrarchaeobius chitinivorans]|uniref:GNAT family N-acetyltransferase n=1 Tax=Natrarchaeobius chitinivorans TaxID=1679083 RepID=A0A3N6MBE2_NATCH|nr:GNAT family N-acetyltransferase [Natrarchaeobius chitinivorans]RQG90966.1 GNAT family N-acetyltransferase [Natrarchaeobius chitinivorans]
MVDVRIAETDRERTDAFAVRQDVFVDEQGVDEDVEYDEYDTDAVHFVAYDDGEPVGAARLRELEDGGGKVERVAVKRAHRNEGIGRALMDVLEREANSRGITSFTLHSQTHAADFYRRLGYERHGPEFDEAGIPHVEMRK